MLLIFSLQVSFCFAQGLLLPQRTNPSPSNSVHQIEVVEYFGMKVINPKNSLLAFEIKGNNYGSINYSYQKSMVDNGITCKGKINYDNQIVLTIENDSKAPLRMNYFVDVYELMLSDGTIYQLKYPDDLESIVKYPDVLNPGDKSTITLDGFNGKAEDVAFISVTLRLSDAFIFLKRID